MEFEIFDPADPWADALIDIDEALAAEVLFARLFLGITKTKSEETPHENR
jgi:hypothetical protein